MIKHKRLFDTKTTFISVLFDSTNWTVGVTWYLAPDRFEVNWGPLPCVTLFFMHVGERSLFTWKPNFGGKNQ